MCLVVSSSPTDLLPGRLSVILSALPTAKLSVAEEQVLSTRIYVYRPFAASLHVLFKFLFSRSFLVLFLRRRTDCYTVVYICRQLSFTSTSVVIFDLFLG